MSTFFENLERSQSQIQDSIKKKLERGDLLTDYEVSKYTLNDDDVKAMNVLDNLVNGEEIPGFDLMDFLSTPQAKILIPRVIIGAAKKNAEPNYIATSFFKKIKLKTGYGITIPSFGAMKAHDIGEAQEVPAETIVWNHGSKGQVNVGKCGIRVQYTGELKTDAEFDIIMLHLAEAGRALGRHKDQKAFYEFIRHGHTVFDNHLYKSNPVQFADAQTTGMDYEGNLNGTLSIDDVLDLLIAMYNNGYTPSDLLMHPLAWHAFAKTGLVGGLTSIKEKDTKSESPNASFRMGPDSMQGRLPFSFNVNLSPFAPVDKNLKTFDLTCVDKNNVGYLVVKDEISTEQFREPARDLNNVQLIERYGFATKDEGRAITNARNISMARTYAQPDRVVVIQKK